MPIPGRIAAIRIARDWDEAALRRYDIDPAAILPRDIARDFLERWYRKEVDLTGLDEFVNQNWEKIRPVGLAWFGAAREFASHEDWSEIAPAIDAGLLTIMGWSDDQPELSESERGYFTRAANGIHSLISEGRQLLAFDQGAEKSLMLESKGERKDLELTKQVLGAIPTFSRAALSEIIDIRRELDSPLVRFRAAMIEIAGDLPSPTDRSYEPEVRDAYRRLIAPELSEIDELTRQNTYLKQLCDAAVDVRTWVPSAVGLGIGIAAFGGVSAISTAAAGLASIPLSALRAKSKKEEVKQNRFFFLWRVRQLSRE